MPDLPKVATVTLAFPPRSEAPIEEIDVVQDMPQLLCHAGDIILNDPVNPYWMLVIHFESLAAVIRHLPGGYRPGQAFEVTRSVPALRAVAGDRIIHDPIDSDLMIVIHWVPRHLVERLLAESSRARHVPARRAAKRGRGLRLLPK